MDLRDAANETLMARFRESFDEAAFGELASRHCRAAFALARSLLHDDGAAEDAVQETFVRVVRQRKSYDPPRPFTPWFFRILRNACLDAQRKRERERRRMLEFAETAAPEAPPSRAPELLELVQALAPEDRELLVLRLVQGLSFRELAAHFGCSEAAAKKRGQRALARLREAKQASDAQLEHCSRP